MYPEKKKFRVKPSTGTHTKTPAACESLFYACSEAFGRTWIDAAPLNFLTPGFEIELASELSCDPGGDHRELLRGLLGGTHAAARAVNAGGSTS